MQFLSNTEEYDLLLKLKNGDQLAFRKLMEIYKRMLARRILHILKSPEDTEEILQELFVRVWVNRHKINQALPLKAYLFHIGENLIFDAIRKANRERRFLLAYQQTHDAEAYSHIEENLYREENRALLNSLIERIPEQSRLVFTLCKLEGRSYEEVGKLLSISTATVNSHISKANRLLKSYIKADSITIVFLMADYFFSRVGQ